jgi:glutaredoxin/glutathione-dependent peroxiredoxin
VTVTIGDRLPAGALKYLENDQQRWVTTDQLFGQRRVVLFSCPGAFTTKSTLRQLPSYLRAADAFVQLGVDAILCISVNDPWVMDAWGRHCGVGERIRMLADAHCEYHTALGLQMDCTRFTLGWRSQRFSMLVNEGRVVLLNIEKPGEYEVSDAEVLLAQARNLASGHGIGGGE